MGAIPYYLGYGGSMGQLPWPWAWALGLRCAPPPLALRGTQYPALESARLGSPAILAASTPMRVKQKPQNVRIGSHISHSHSSHQLITSLAQ
eukprot:7089126-Prymnesium_polylepis.1